MAGHAGSGRGGVLGGRERTGGEGGEAQQRDEERRDGEARPGIVELIYAFKPAVWGRGYATEAAAGLVAFGFAACGMARIEATIDPENAASRRVLEKVGMAFLRQETDPDGASIDVYAIERPLVPE